jgi:hypothetical protein
MIKLLAGKLWFYKIEGLPCFNGINVYRKIDENSKGFIFRLGTFHFKCRYSKRTNKWIIKAYISKEGYQEYKI